MEQRIENIRQWLKKEDIGFAFVNSPANVYYLSNFNTDPHERLLGLFIFKEQSPLLICPSMEVGQVKQAGWKHDIIGYNDSENPWEKLKPALENKEVLGSESIAVEKDFLSYSRALSLLTLCPKASLTSLEQKINQLRMIKDQKEIEILREAASFADLGVEIGVKALQAGKTEMEIVATIEYELKKKGISQMSFSTMVLAGEKTAFPHGKPGLDEMKEGDLILFDLGVVHKGYCSDITRTVAYKSISPKQQEIYETVLKAEEEAVKICKPGTRLGDIDTTARKIIADKGYGEYFVHRIGHGLGIEVHEYPSMNDSNNELAKPGMTFTIEPGIYIEGVGGVRIEDDVLITEDGYETLTKYPKELIIIK
jgi:Xaa-Pro dipeptidase